MKRLFLAVLCVWAAVAHAQTYSRIKQHVREYDGVIEQVEDLLPYLPTNYVAYSNDLAGYMAAPDSPQTAAFVQYDGTNYVTAYGPRTSIDAFDAVTTHGAGALGVLYPGQLLYMDIAADGSRHQYICTNTLDSSLFATNDTTWLPAGAADDFWTVFSRQGPTGSAGAAGEPGATPLDGVGNMQYGIWDNSKTYLYDTGTPVVVSYAGRWYDCVASSTGQIPTAVGATNYWAISVDKGDDGEIIGWTNLVFRDSWDSGETYTTNDAVWRYGNLFAVSETNAAPAIGVAPSAPGPSYEGSNTAYWTCLLSRGARGAQGPDGNTINSYTVYSLFNTNTLFAVSPAASAGYRLPMWQSSDSVSTTMVWSASAPLGTNNLSATGGVLYLNGVEYGSGNTNISELWTSETDTNLVLRPDGANGVEWGEETAEADPVYSAWVTNGPGATNAILADGTLVSIDGLGAGGGTGGTTNSTALIDMGDAPANWIIDFTAGAAQSWGQTHAITNIAFTVHSTNEVAYCETVLLSDTNAITWTNIAGAVRWASGASPTHTTGTHNTVTWRAWRGAVDAVYIGATP